MLPFPLMLRVNLLVVGRIQRQSNKFATGVEKEATGESKLNDSPFCNMMKRKMIFSVIYI